MYKAPSEMVEQLSYIAIVVMLLAGCGPASSSSGTSGSAPADRIQPHAENPRYWQYEGVPVLLLGGTKDDNLFQIPNLEEHLDLLTSVGGNYIRNTMSARQDGGFEVHAFEMLEDGTYDLGQWNPEYWQRFERMLALTHERDVIVQIELWDQWDHNEEDWNDSPWNPDRNVNYDTSAVTLQGKGGYDDVRHDTGVPHDLFLTVPGLQDDRIVLAHQKRFIDKMLEYTFQYDHLLYTITNELFTQHPAAWSRYWERYLRERAGEEGVQIEITEMFHRPDVQHEQHRANLDHPETFDYVELSQNAGQEKQAHWDKLQWARSYLAQQPRPINHVKIYGGEIEWTEGIGQGVDRFWRNLIGGAASVRFHRPRAGIGLSERAQAHLRSARMLSEAMNLFAAQPDVGSRLLSGRSDDEAYLTYIAGAEYAVYFPNGGAVDLDLTETDGSLGLRWLNIAESRWQGETTVEGAGRVPLETPGTGDWVALLETW